MTDSDSDLICQFSLAGLPVDNRDKLTASIYDALHTTVGKDHIKGYMLRPRKWAQRAIIFCMDAGTKKKLLDDGMKINEMNIDFIDGGGNQKKILVDDAPFDMPSEAILAELSKFGDTSGGKHQPFFRNNVKTNWISGTRLFYLSNIKVTELPPTLTVQHKGVMEKLCIRHEGQTLYECRFCLKHVARGDHECNRRPKKKCFNCDSPDHLNYNCPNVRRCHKCQSADHMARNCPQNQTRAKTAPAKPGAASSAPEQPGTASASPKQPNAVPLGQRGAPVQDSQRPSGSGRKPFTFGDIPIVVKRIVGKGKKPRRRRDSGEPAGADAEGVDTQATGSSESPSATSVISDAYKRLDGKVTIDALLMGDSNSRGLSLNPDDDLDIKMMTVWEGGCQINDAQAKFEDLPANIGLSHKQAVVTNVGACNFPVSSEEDIDRLFMEYVELLGSINRRCPNARVYICSIPPRRGYLNCRVKGASRIYGRGGDRRSCQTDT